MADPRTAMVIHDGSLAGLVATLLLLERGSTAVAWFVPSRASHLSALGVGPPAETEAQAAILGIDRVVPGEIGPPGDQATAAAWPRRANPRVAAELLEAAEVASASAIRHLEWPIVAGDDLDRLAAATRLAQSVASIVRLDTAATPLDLRTPLAERTGSQLEELATELNAHDLLRAAPSPASPPARPRSLA